MQRTLGTVGLALLAASVGLIALGLPLNAEEAAASAKPDPMVIGASLVQRKSGCKVRMVYENGPAYKAGLRTGDRLLQVNGKAVDGLKNHDVIHLIQQKDPVVLQIRDSAGKTRSLTIAKVKHSAVTKEWDGLPNFLHDPLDELKPGDVAPDITALYLDGKQIKLSDWRGKPVLVVFWATWCVPCVNEIPTLLDVYRKYHDKGLEILGVSFDSDKLKLDKFLTDEKIPWPQHFDGMAFDGGISMEWGLSFIPVVALIDKHGKIVEENLPVQQIEKAVQAALGSTAAKETVPAAKETSEERIARLEARIKQLEEQQRVTRPSRTMTPPMLNEPKGVDREALAKISLPSNPTKEDVRSYVLAILDASRGQNCWSTEDPQVAMLTLVGESYVPLLIEAMRRTREGSYYIVPALKVLVADKHKKVVLDALATNPELASLIIQKRWEKDAQAILLRGLQAKPSYLPGEWIQAVANLRDPSTYEALKEFLIYGSNRYFTYQAIYTLPDMDLSQTIKLAWDRASTDGHGRVERQYFARVAAEYGIKEALDILFDSLGDEEYMNRETRRVILRITDARGSDVELQGWYKSNKDKLKFNSVIRRYEVVEK